LNAAKSPGSVTKQRTPQKCYKHIALFSLNNITKVCDILQNNDDTDLFGILCRLAGEKDKFYSFKVAASSNNFSNGGIGSMISNSNSGNNLNVNSISGTASVSQSQSGPIPLGLSNAALMSTSSSIYASIGNLSTTEESSQAQLEKKEYIKLLAQGICNVKCITEYVRSYSIL
jgi:hypothetical protein